MKKIIILILSMLILTGCVYFSYDQSESVKIELKDGQVIEMEVSNVTFDYNRGAYNDITIYDKNDNRIKFNASALKSFTINFKDN